MALAMMRQNTPNGAPPLPARHSGQPGAPISHSGRSQSVEQPTVHHVRYERRTSEDTRQHMRQPEPAHIRAQPAQRRDVETKSFISRNTAKAFSDPDAYKPETRRQVDHVEYPPDENCPPPPPISTLPRTVSSAGDRKKPSLTPSQPPTPPIASPPNRKVVIQVGGGGGAPSRPPTKAPQNDHAPPPPGRPPKAHDTHAATNPTPARPPKSLTLPPQPERPPKTIQSPGSNLVSPGRQAQSPDLPGRPPTVPMRRPSIDQGSNSHSPMHELEKRFCFHGIEEFPDPEPFSNGKKTRASMSMSMKRVDQKERMGYL